MINFRLKKVKTLLKHEQHGMKDRSVLARFVTTDPWMLYVEERVDKACYVEHTVYYIAGQVFFDNGSL